MTRHAATRFELMNDDGLPISCVRWSGPRPARGGVQIAHGLGEHMERYAELAETLLRAEFVIYGPAHALEDE